MNKVERTAHLAEKALRELIAQGSRINQSAVEKLAGLSNGTLNYDTKLYKDIKKRIALARLDLNNSSESTYQKRNTGDLKKQIELKDKYRRERDWARRDLKKLLGEQAELIHHTITLQTYLAHLEKSGKTSGVVVNIKSSTNNNQS